MLLMTQSKTRTQEYIGRYSDFVFSPQILPLYISVPVYTIVTERGLESKDQRRRHVLYRILVFNLFGRLFRFLDGTSNTWF